jgi:cell fate (sporulation/competence/biofilm development) regulator YlbF (YheA/YmcA/DUF963 family)
MAGTEALAVNNTGIATPEQEKAIARFAQALSATPAFMAFEAAAARLSSDTAALAALQAYQEKLQSLDLSLRFGFATSEERDELERLRQACDAQPSVAAYAAAQRELSALCQAAADTLSERLGIEYAAACKTGSCCG